MAYCTKCGTEWPEDVHFCGKCGIPLLSEPDTEPTERISKSSHTSIGGKTEPSEVETLIGAGKLAIKYSSILAVLFIGSIFLIIFGLGNTFEVLAVVFILILIYLFVKDSLAVQNPPTSSSESVRDVPIRDDTTLYDDVASPLKTLGKYVIGIIGVFFLLIAALAMSTHEGTLMGYRFLLIVGAAISIYVISRMPETSERLNRNQKIAAIVGIIVVAYFVFNQIDEPDNSFLGKFSNAMSSGNYGTVCSMMMESDGQFISGSERQTCIDELQSDCGSDGCDVGVSLINSSDTGEQAEYTENIYEYKVRVTNKAEGSHSWCEIWYVAKNIDSGEQGMPKDSFVSKSGKMFETGEDVSC